MFLTLSCLLYTSLLSVTVRLWESLVVSQPLSYTLSHSDPVTLASSSGEQFSDAHETIPTTQYRERNIDVIDDDSDIGEVITPYNPDYSKQIQQEQTRLGHQATARSSQGKSNRLANK